MFPSMHPAAPLIVSFYGGGATLIGDALHHFFNTVPIFGPRTELCGFMSECGSDKGSGRHNYTLLYDFLFRPRRFEVTDVFEVGLGTNYSDVPSNLGPNATPGASLRGWRAYFPHANIVGADVDRRILFSEERISTCYVDQTDPKAITEMWRMLPQKFDIIVDDGLHTFEANSCFFENSYNKLKKWGYYIIEDIIVSKENLQKFHDYFSRQTAPGVILRLPHAYNGYDNCLALFRG